jgi:Flp pilus assembly protein TadD
MERTKLSLSLRQSPQPLGPESSMFPLKRLPARNLTACVLMLAFGFAGLATPGKSAGPDALLPGKQLLLSGKFQQASAWFHAAKQKRPGDSQVYFYSGVAFMKLADFASAAWELNEAVRLQPNRPEYQVYQASALERLNHKNQARSILADLDGRRLAGILPANDLLLLSEVYYRLEMNDEALQVLDALSRRQDTRSDVDLSRGYVYVSKREYDRAIKCFEQSIRKHPENNPQAYFELGKILHQQNQLDNARQKLLVSVKQSSERAEYLHRLGVVCLDLGMAEEALVYLKRAEPLGPTLPKILFALSRAYRAKGDSTAAEDYANRFQTLVVTQKTRDDRELRSSQLIEQGEKEMDAGRTAKARELFEEATRVNPQSWDAHGYLAEMLLDSDAWAAARPHLTAMEAIDPNSPVGNFLMATYQYRSQNLQQALQYAQRVKTVHPGNAELRNLLGNIQSALGQTRQALDEYTTAVQLAPNRADYRQNLQAAQRASGLPSEPGKK